MKIDVTLNGEAVVDDVEPRVLLSAYLREHRKLTGVKLSCEAGVCGACTVLVDGLPMSSCSTLAVDADGRSVTTIEGLAGATALHPIQQAFASTVAFQCGFCTPGMILALKGLLDITPSPTRAEVVEAIEGNLCRCGTYPAILDAVDRAVAAMSER
jgi:aerobic-type carbon monoxide dehydrogenase small subunit (CoxS/CutS family)